MVRAVTGEGVAAAWVAMVGGASVIVMPTVLLTEPLVALTTALPGTVGAV